MAITRQFIFAIDPTEGVSNTFAFAAVPDGNTTGKAFTCGVVPTSKGTGVNIMQETIILGTTSASGKTFQAFKDTLSMDGSDAIRGRAISHRIDPEARADSDAGKSVIEKRFHRLSWNGNNPQVNGTDVQWAADADPLNDPVVTWMDFGGPDDEEMEFESAIASWIILKIDDTTNNVNVPIIPPFEIQYYIIGKGTEN